NTPKAGCSTSTPTAPSASALRAGSPTPENPHTTTPSKHCPRKSVPPSDAASANAQRANATTVMDTIRTARHPLQIISEGNLAHGPLADPFPQRLRGEHIVLVVRQQTGALRQHGFGTVHAHRIAVPPHRRLSARFRV